MEAVSTLIVIEAPGKIAALSRALKSIHMRAQICATKGLLFSLPEKSMGLNPDTLVPNEWVPIRQRSIDDLVHAAKSATQVFVMTDADIEGELIASQVRGVLVRNGFAGSIERVRPTAITPEALKACLAHPGELNRSSILQAMARRAIDRGIGFILSNTKTNFNAVAGRVRAQLLGSIHAKPLPTHRLAGSHESEPGWNINAEGTPAQAASLNALCDAFHRKSPELFGYTKKKDWIVPPAPPPIGAEAILLIAGRLNIPVGEAQQLIQTNYESGKLSYPRTDSRRYSPATTARLKTLGKRYGLRIRNDEPEWESPESAQEAHEALHVLEGDPCLGMSISEMRKEDAAQTLLVRRSLAPLCPDAEVSREAVPLRAIHAFLDKRNLPRVGAAIWKDTPESAGWMVLERGTIASARVQDLPADQAILKRIITDDIGRPSTAVSFVQAMLQNKLVDGGRLSRSGYANFKFIESVAPSLTRKHNLDNFLGSHCDGALEDAIKAGYGHLGLDTGELSRGARERLQAQEVDAPDLGDRQFPQARAAG
ncbi:DNA topoisomerase [Geopseudomonas aromaticivorans]